MISANVIEEIHSKGWRRADIISHEIDGKKINEELWMRRNKVEVRRSGRCVKLLSGDDEVLQCCFTRFENEDDVFIAIREATRLRIYSAKGEEFLVALPIEVARMWSSMYGLILEGKSSEQDYERDVPMPKLIAIHHPLDDIGRVVTKRKPAMGLSEWRNDRNQIVMVAEDPSLCVTFDHQLGLHSVWYLRKTQEEDSEGGVVPDVIGTPQIRHSMSFTGVGHGGLPTNPNLSMTQKLMPLFNTSRLSMPQTPGQSAPSSQQTTPYQSSHSVSTIDILSGKPTPNTSTSAPNSPQVMSTMAQICRSPAAATPVPSSSKVASFLPASDRLFMPASPAQNSTMRNPEEPLPPDISICMSHLWTEPSMLKKNTSAADKVFMSTDFVGRQFLCFLDKESKTLTCIRIDGIKDYKDNDGHNSALTFGSSNILKGVSDATPCPDLGMILAMGAVDSLCLYSGTTKVCRVHFNYSPSVQMAHIAQEIATLQLQDPNMSVNMSSADVVTSSRPSSAVDPKFFHDSSLVLLSPVASGSPQVMEMSVKQPEMSELLSVTCNVAFIGYTNGLSVRLALPPMTSSSLVSRCLQALTTSIDSNEARLSLLSQWYKIRNSPGPSSISNAFEWELFAKCVLELMGYHTDSIDFNTEEGLVKDDSSLSPSGPSKKMRQENPGCDEDWHQLLSSKRHYESGKQLSFVLGIENIVADQDSNDKPMEENVISVSSPLFYNFGNIVTALHLLYEDSKLNKFCWEGLPWLASLLSKLAADLDLEKYGKLLHKSKFKTDWDILRYFSVRCQLAPLILAPGTLVVVNWLLTNWLPLIQSTNDNKLAPSKLAPVQIGS